jgi:plastocyanin
MAVIHDNLYFIILVVAAMSLLPFGITTQNTSATTSEIRMLADLNPANGVMADGRADYRERDGAMRLNVEVEDVTPNTTFTIEVSGNTLGTITTNSFGIAELELNTNDGQIVPRVLRGDVVQIFQGIQLVLSGSFNEEEDDDDTIITNQAPIVAPAQNASMQPVDNSTGTITTVITIPQDADDLGAGAYSPNPASVSDGSTMTWNNVDSTPHTATADDGSFDSGIINGGSSASVAISANSGVNTIPYHCSVHPEMRGTLQIIPSSSLSTVPSSNSTLQNAPVTVTNSNNTSTISSGNNTTIQNLQQEIVALQQTVDELQQALTSLQQSVSQDGNVTISTNSNNTSVSSIGEEQPSALLPQSQQQQQPQLQQQQHQQQNQTVSIILDSSTLIDNPGFQPSQIQAQVGDTVTWINDDLQPHTVTSGSNGVPDNKFNSSPNFIPLMTPGGTFSHTFTEAGEYPYFCLLHPNMIGTVSVIS